MSRAAERVVSRVILAALIASPSAVGAQSVSGGISGRIVTETGSGLAGAEVIVRSEALQGVKRDVTDRQGRYVLLALPAGRYQVEVRSVGYTQVRMTDIVVPLGATVSLEAVKLQRRQAVQLDEVVIAGTKPAISVASAASSTTLDSSLFRALPTARDVRSLLSIVPQGNPSFFGDGVNISGSTGFENAYFINGIHATNPLSGDGGISVPFNFVREVQVVTGGYEAEFGRGQGAIVNILTNSGGNELRGEVVSYFAGQQLRATPRWGIAESPDDRFTQYDIGVSLGGPIRKDRLWFFAAYNPLVETRDVTFSGLGTEEDRRVRQLFSGKLTWQPGSSTNVNVTVIGDPTRHDAVSPAEVWEAPQSTIADRRVILGAFREGGTAGSVEVRHQAGSRVLVSGSLASLTNTRQHALRIGNDDPATLARVDDYVEGITSGNFGRSYRVHSRRTAASGMLTVLASAHTIKLGVSLERNALHVPFFRASRIERVATDRYRWSQDAWGGRGRNEVPAAFVQDSWEVSPRLRVNYGLRWDGQYIRGDTGIRLSIRDAFAPRIGVVVQPGSLGDHKLTASYGRFYEQIPLWAVSFWSMAYHGRVGVYPRNPLVDSSGAAPPLELAFAGNPVDSYLKGQHYDEITAGYDRRAGMAHRLAVRAVWRDLRWVVEDAINEGGTLDSGFEWHLGNPGRGLLAHVPRATRRYAGMTIELERTMGALRYLASYTLSRTRGNYSGEFETDTRVPASHFQQSLDWPVQWPHQDGALPNDRNHLAKLSGRYRAGALSMGLAAYYASGTPLSEMAVGPLPYVRVHVRDRGTVGRSPDIWNADVRFAYALAASGTWSPQIVLDVFNLGNQRRAVDFEQLHYTDLSQANENPSYMKVNLYQAPLRARLGMVIGF